MLLFMVMPALFGGFGNLIIGKFYFLLNTRAPCAPRSHPATSVGLRGLNIDNKENEEEDNYTTTVEDFQNQYNKVLHNSANFTIKSKQLYNPQLGPYLAGLIEGDGHISFLCTYREVPWT